MAENAFLTAVDTFLEGAGLSLTPASVGPVEPSTAADLPALVLSLENGARPGNGLGERSAIRYGALPWSAAIDLANPVLPEDTSVVLLSEDRTVLTLPHGGLVRADGTTGALTGADLTVTVDGVSRTVVASSPTGNQVSCDPNTGELTFGDALPDTGTVQATYNVGQWEQRVVRLRGELRVDVLAVQTADVMTLSSEVLDALAGGAAMRQILGLSTIEALAVGSIGLREPDAANARRRTLRFAFQFEHEINRPDSSGGVIRKVPVDIAIGPPN